jgi:hypothetical protein
MVITQVHLVLGTKKGHSNVQFYHKTQMSQVLREHAIGMLTAGMSTRDVVREWQFEYTEIP